MKRFLLATLCMFLLGGVGWLGMNAGKLEAGDGAMILQARCTVCHGAGRIERAGHDLDGWKNTVGRMMGKRNFGPELNDAELQALLDHLTSLKP